MYKPIIVRVCLVADVDIHSANSILIEAQGNTAEGCVRQTVHAFALRHPDEPPNLADRLLQELASQRPKRDEETEEEEPQQPIRSEKPRRGRPPKQRPAEPADGAPSDASKSDNAEGERQLEIASASPQANGAAT